MEISLEDVRHALVELGRLRFGETSLEDAIREVVQTTHSMFDVDGAGLMLADSSQHLRNVAASDGRFAHLKAPASRRSTPRSWSAPPTWGRAAVGRCSARLRSTETSEPCSPARCPTTRTRSAS